MSFINPVYSGLIKIALPISIVLLNKTGALLCFVILTAYLVTTCYHTIKYGIGILAIFDLILIMLTATTLILYLKQHHMPDKPIRHMAGLTIHPPEKPRPAAVRY